MVIPQQRDSRRARVNRTRYVALGMLANGPMTGYAMRQAIARSVGHFWQESYGQLYPTLHRLADEGLAVARPKSGGPGRDSAAYSITERGRAELARWLALPPVLEARRDEVLLKTFFAGAVPPSVTAANLGYVADRVRASLSELEAIAGRWQEKTRGHPNAPFWRLTLDFGLSFHRMLLRWVEHAQAVVRAPRSSARADTARSKRSPRVHTGQGST
jgi:PadR family transcriptional regulator AphA